MRDRVLKTTTIFLLIAIFVSSFSIAAVSYAEEMEVMAPARGMVLLEGNTNQVLYEFNANKSLPMASTTKIVTAIVAIENYPELDKVVRVSDKAVGIEGTSIYLKHGEEITMRDLLFGLILASGNDCAVAIAEEVFGEDKFVTKMNEFASNLGLSSTHFTNPHGLDAEGHYTSAYDLACITSYAMKNPIFREIAGTKYHNIKATNVYQERYLKHKNKLMFLDDNCIGVKTGFTDNAGRCLVSVYEKDGMQLISVVLNCQPMFEEANRLTQNALSEYKYKEWVKPYNYVSSISIEDGDKNEIGLVTIKGFANVIRKSEEREYRVEYDLPEQIVAPIEANRPIGKVRVYKGENVIFEEPLFAIDSCKNIDLKYTLDNILNNWI